MSEDPIADLGSKCHIVFLHNKFRKKPDDRYIIDLATGLKEYGHKVTIVTTGLDTTNCFPEISVRKIASFRNAVTLYIF